MKRYLTLLLIAIFSTTAVWSQTSPKEGDIVSVCGKVVSADYKISEDEKPTFLVVGSQAESQMTVLIKSDSRKKFDYKPEKDLMNREICVTGKLVSVDGKLHIMVSKQSEITIKD